MLVNHKPPTAELLKIQQAIGPHEALLTTAKSRKLQWYGHFSRSLGLAKIISQDTLKGERRQGRQRKRWEDNIRERTGLEFAKSQMSVENRENGGNWLWNHLWCPNDTSRLRDRWWWRTWTLTSHRRCRKSGLCKEVMDQNLYAVHFANFRKNRQTNKYVFMAFKVRLHPFISWVRMTGIEFRKSPSPSNNPLDNKWNKRNLIADNEEGSL